MLGVLFSNMVFMITMTDIYGLRCLFMNAVMVVEYIKEHAMNDIFKLPELSIQQI